MGKLCGMLMRGTIYSICFGIVSLLLMWVVAVFLLNMSPEDIRSRAQDVLGSAQATAATVEP